MKLKLLSLASLIVVCFSCSPIKSNSEQPINIDTQTDSFNELSKKINIVKCIELPEDDLIGEVRKLIAYNSNYYLLDKKTNKISCFNSNGELQFSIHKVGRGADEYIGIANFYINREAKSINIITSDNRLYKCSLADGEFIEASTIDTKAMMVLDGIEYNNGEEIFSELGSKFCLNAGDSGYIPFIEARDFVPSDISLCLAGENVLYVHGCDDTVYEITKDTVVSKYPVNFGANSISTDKYISSPDQIEGIYETKTVATKLDNIVDSKNYISFSYMLFPPKSVNIKTQYVMFNKKDNEVYNILSAPALYPIRASIGDTFISTVYPYSVLESKEKSLQPIKDYIEKNNIKEDANPLIVLWKL